jgi:hypothetical protein
MVHLPNAFLHLSIVFHVHVDGVRRTATSKGPVVHPPGDILWVWRAMVEWYCQRKTEELEKPISLPLCPPQIPFGVTRTSVVTNRLSHGKRLILLLMQCMFKNIKTLEVIHCCPKEQSRCLGSSMWICHELDDRSSIPSRRWTVSLLHSIQTGARAHPGFYPMRTEGSVPGGWGKMARTWSQPHTSIKCPGWSCVELNLHSP